MNGIKYLLDTNCILGLLKALMATQIPPLLATSNSPTLSAA